MSTKIQYLCLKTAIELCKQETSYGKEGTTTLIYTFDVNSIETVYKKLISLAARL